MRAHAERQQQMLPVVSEILDGVARDSEKLIVKISEFNGSSSLHLIIIDPEAVGQRIQHFIRFPEGVVDHEPDGLPIARLLMLHNQAVTQLVHHGGFFVLEANLILQHDGNDAVLIKATSPQGTHIEDSVLVRDMIH